jgi:regulator of sirC expression with transglutaminase-like and TPR domain
VPSGHPFADSPEFLRLLRGEDEPDLTRVAMEIARDSYPTLDVPAYLARIDLLADRVRERCPEGAKPRHILGQINWVLFVEEKFHGNEEDYYDARNSYLNQVLDRKTGIPISLSALYLAVADRLGLAMSGVNLPAHFVLRTGKGEGTIFIDPFHAGTILDRRGCEKRVAEVTGQSISLPESALAPCSTETIVLRMLRNLKASYLRDHDFPSALPVLRRLVALTRNDPDERRDLGVCCLHAGHAGESLGHLSAYLVARPSADDGEDVSALMQVARREVASWN